MKLVITLSLDAYDDVLRTLFEEQGIAIYSRLPIEGVRAADPTAQVALNWFGRRAAAEASTMSFAFTDADQVPPLLDALRAYNTTHPSQRPIRAFVMPVEEIV